jgi:hypothetical protein
MRYRKIILASLVCILGIFVGFSSSFAYKIWYSNGFSPIPAVIYVYSDASNATKDSISSACSAWNNAGCGTLVIKSSSTHNNTKFPYENSQNQITAGYRGTNSYIVRTTKVSYSDTWSELYEVDIDINQSYPFSNSGASDAIDVQSCMTHELGHLLGLDDVTNDSDATMYYKIGYGETRFQTLSADDKDGIKYIY